MPPNDSERMDRLEGTVRDVAAWAMKEDPPGEEPNSSSRRKKPAEAPAPTPAAVPVWTFLDAADWINVYDDTAGAFDWTGFDVTGLIPSDVTLLLIRTLIAAEDASVTVWYRKADGEPEVELAHLSAGAVTQVANSDVRFVPCADTFDLKVDATEFASPHVVIDIVGYFA